MSGCAKCGDHRKPARYVVARRPGGYDDVAYRSLLDDIYDLEERIEHYQRREDNGVGGANNRDVLFDLEQDLAELEAEAERMRSVLKTGSVRLGKLDPEVLKSLNGMSTIQQGSDKLVQYADAILQQYQQLIDKVVPNAGEDPVNAIIGIGSAAAELSKRMQEVVDSSNKMQKQMETLAKNAGQDPNKTMR